MATQYRQLHQIRSPLGDLFGGLNRPQLNSFVATSQARNGLVSAQTQEAMIKAAQAQEQMQAWDRIKADFIAKGASDSDATLARDGVVGAANHDAVNAEKMIQAGNTAVLSNPALIGSAQQTAAQQGNKASWPRRSLHLTISSCLQGRRLPLRPCNNRRRVQRRPRRPTRSPG